MRIRSEKEEWKAITGYENYSISSYGRVASLPRIITRSNGTKLSINFRILRPIRHGSYLSVFISNEEGTKQFKIHQLVIEHFIGPKPSPLHECSHKDRNGCNNYYKNLEWSTHADNVRHSSIGNRSKNAKLNRRDVEEIRSLCEQKMSYQVIADKFNISKQHICTIHKRRCWRHIDG